MAQGDRKDSGIGFASGLLIGGFVGAILAILFAPQSGEETREFLRDKAQEAKGRALDLASDLKDRATTVQSQLRSQADELQARGRDFVDKTYDQVSKAVAAGKDAAQAKIDEFKKD